MKLRAKLAVNPFIVKWVATSVVALIISVAAIACGDSSSSQSGDTAPDFSLPVANRSYDITLSDFRDDKNVILVFYRGFF